MVAHGSTSIGPSAERLVSQSAKSEVLAPNIVSKLLKNKTHKGQG